MVGAPAGELTGEGLAALPVILLPPSTLALNILSFLTPVVSADFPIKVVK